MQKTLSSFFNLTLFFASHYFELVFGYKPINCDEVMLCNFAHFCSGCSLWGQSYTQQKQSKIEFLAHAFPEILIDQIEFQSFGEYGLRSRLDFVLDQDRLGLFSHQSRRIEDLSICLQLSPELQNFYSKFRSIIFPKIKGSFRLRISPKKKYGIWLDFSNLDIKSILKNHSLMDSLTSMAVVEMGQKHKNVTYKENKTWGLNPPIFHEWTESFYKNQFTPLVSTVASFSQPSHISNKWIVTQINQILTKIQPTKILEFGSGFGNLTFPSLFNDSVQITCLEFDSISVEALKHNVQCIGVEQQVTIHKGDFRKKLSFNFDYDFVLVNPARNGVGQMFDTLESLQKKPQAILYMSCYPETLILDSQKLKKLGYHLTSLKIADQFPQTKHMEVISLWQK